jgi:hypothetical protein
MKLLLSFRSYAVIAILLFVSQQAESQYLMDMLDTTKDVGKGLLSIYKRFDHIRISGYMQPQFQVAQKKGAKSFNGGDFSAHASNRFMLRRGRIRFDYVHYNKLDQPSVHFVFQFDGTERGVVIRDFWGRFLENKWQMFMVTTGMFARPFGYEINVSSSDRESPERGRMSQILMKTERDLGVMGSFEPRKPNHPLRYFKLDIGAFNGQGLAGPNEYDSYKDVIGRLSLKPYPLSKTIRLSAGLSLLQGGLVQNTKYLYRTTGTGNNKFFYVDSSAGNYGGKAPRKYYGADVQVKVKHGWGETEWRGEYWWGTQTAIAGNSETPGTLLNEPYYIRQFNGAFFYLLQTIINKQHQVGIKYDWYDPNTHVRGREIGLNGNNIQAGDIRYDTWSVGYNYYINDNLKLMLWYDRVQNENTSLASYAGDLKDNIFTCRLQFRF